MPFSLNGLGWLRLDAVPGKVNRDDSEDWIAFHRYGRSYFLNYFLIS